MRFHVIFFIMFCLVCLPVVYGVSNRFVFKINGDIRELKDNLRDYDFTYMFKITPTVYSFKYVGSLSTSNIELVLSEVKQVYKDSIMEIEQAKECINCIPVDRLDVMSISAVEENGQDRQNEEDKTYFGLNVEKVWLHGYSGNGINVAVLDVGINTDITDLRKNINNALVFNFIINSTNVTPEKFPHYLADSLRYVDHGNRCASVIAAEKGNGVCSAGIAYEAKVVPLKVFSVEHEYHLFKLKTSSDITAAALAYGLQHIHIYSNSWAPPDKFEPLDMATKEAILHGITTGRNKLGAIYVVPDGSDGISSSGLANSIHTITVNNVGVNGVYPTNVQVSASVLTSGLGGGNRINTNNMLTASYNNRCVESFKGVSAAVAEISAIIALALQANPLLSYRDIQHLVVQSSGQQHIAKDVEFKRNAAGKSFNFCLGFGLIDAEKMITLAKTWSLVGNMYSNKLYSKGITHTIREGQQHKYQNTPSNVYDIEFKMEENVCNRHVDTIEHVVLSIDYCIITHSDMILVIISPSKTTSIVVNNANDDQFNQDTAHRNLTSVHFWGENPFGSWKIHIQLPHTIDESHLKSASLIVYGTFNESKRHQTCVSFTQGTTTATTKKAKNTADHLIEHYTLYICLLVFWTTFVASLFLARVF